MKFVTNQKVARFALVSLVILLFNLNSALSLRLSTRQENLEVQALNLTIKCNGTEAAKGVVLLKTVQKVENVNGVNKNYGCFGVNLENADDTMVNHFMNFGLMPDKKNFELDMRMILNCDMAVSDEGENIGVQFKVNTKDSLNPAVSDFSFLINKNKNKITDIQTYFEKANKLCVSTQKWANELKNKLITRLTQMISFTPAMKKVSPSDLQDPGAKVNLQNIETKLDKDRNLTNQLEQAKKDNNAEILKYQKEIDEKSRSLVILQKEQELNKQKEESAKKAISDAEAQMKDAQKTVEDETKKKNDFINQTNSIKQEINNTETDLNKLKGTLNNINNQINDLNSQLSDIESKIKVEQQNLSTLTTKKNNLINDIVKQQERIQDNNKNIESLKREGQNLQNEYNNVKNEVTKFDANIKEFKDKISQVIDEQNRIPSNRQSELERQETQENQIRATVAQIDEQLKPVMDDIQKVVNSVIGDNVNQAYQKAIDPNNYDFAAVKYLLSKIPDTLWKPKDKNKMK